MTIWKNKKDNRLYVIYECYYPCTGGYIAEPYGRAGKIIRRATLHNFIKIGFR